MSMSLSPTAVDAYIPSLLPLINTAIKQWVDMGRLPVLAVVSFRARVAWHCSALNEEIRI